MSMGMGVSEMSVAVGVGVNDFPLVMDRGLQAANAESQLH